MVLFPVATLPGWDLPAPAATSRQKSGMMAQRR
jgi:hypothetical protein